MSAISFSKEPGYYLEPGSVSLVLTPNVKNVQYTQNAGAPSISKYVAYDQSSPPVPFIAVTQDGKGNVVYDGGFPKFYNTSAPAIDVARGAFDHAMRLRVRCITTNTAVNSHYYERINTGSVVIAAGDRLVYDISGYGAKVLMGVDADVINHAQPVLRHIVEIRDQNNLDPHPARDITAYAKDRWYRRVFDLTPAAGATLNNWSFGFEGDDAGDFTGYLANAFILDAEGTVKFTIFDTVLNVPGQQLAWSAANSNHTFISKDVITPMSQLTPSFRYLYNAMRFIANPTKVGAGNRNVLVLGDAKAAENYATKSTVASGFNTSLQRFARAGDWTFVFKDPSDFAAGVLDARLAELEQYCCVVFFSTIHGPARITQECVDDLILYREAGSGMVFITDHGPVLNTIQEAVVNDNGFFAAANRVITNFGCWFSGNYNRVPVNVGYLRTNYGDHPLYNGMSNAEDISAGGSESRVHVAPTTSYLPSQVPPFTLVNGRNTIQVAAELTDGSVETVRVYFYVVAFKITFSDGKVTRDQGQVLDIGVLNRTLMNVAFVGESDAVVNGVVYKNGARVGTLTYDPVTKVNKQTWDGAGAGEVKVVNGDAFKVHLTSPIEYDAVLTIKRFQPAIEGETKSADVLKRLRQFQPALTDIGRMKKMIADIGSQVPYLGLKPIPSLAMNLNLIAEYFSDRGLASQVLPSAGTKAYANRPWNADTTTTYSKWIPTNPITGTVMDFKYVVHSPVYGSESVPGDFRMDYYAYIYIEAGNYRIFSFADDIFELTIDGGLAYSGGARTEKDLAFPESRYYALKVSNVNVPANTPSWWTMLFVNLVSGVVSHQPSPGVWKTQEYSTT